MSEKKKVTPEVEGKPQKKDPPKKTNPRFPCLGM